MEQRLEDRLRKTKRELWRLQRQRGQETAKKSPAREDPMADWPTPDQFPDLSSPE